MSNKLACLLISVFATSVKAEWTTIVSDPRLKLEHYIDQDSVKQSGPMAIYRQVQVLRQGDELAKLGIQSVLGNYEYDCMNVKFRTLHEIAYKELWAKGESSVMSPAVGMSEWMTLPQNPLGQMTFDLVCPSGNDSQ